MYLAAETMPKRLPNVQKPQPVLANLPTPFRSPWLAPCIYVALAIGAGLGILGKSQLITHVVPLPGAVVLPLVFACVLLPVAWQLALKARLLVGPLMLLGILSASLFIYPRMQVLQQTTHRGSDQADCVVVAANGIAHAQWPYDPSRLWTHDPMSCGPGWVLLQTPAIVAAGYRWNLVAVWLLALGLLYTALPVESVFGLLALLGLSAVTWVASSDGTDFLPFGILLTALFVILQTRSRLDGTALVLLMLVVQFRFPMLILPVLLLPSQRLRHGVYVSLLAFCFQLGFLLWRPEAYIAGGPLHLFYKLTHTHLFALSRESAALEVSVVFALMLSLAVLVRRYVSSPWVGFLYLLALTVIPATLDLAHKRREFGSLLAGLGLWEGANWISACLPMAALLLVVRIIPRRGILDVKAVS